jgi:hypothetical protein
VKPDALFSSVEHNLKSDGLFVMVNHGPDEAQIAADCCSAAGLKTHGSWEYSGHLSSYRAGTPVIPPWRHSRGGWIECSSRIYQLIAVALSLVRELLLGPFMVTAPLWRHLDHNLQSRLLRSGWLALLLRFERT